MTDHWKIYRIRMIRSKGSIEDKNIVVIGMINEHEASRHIDEFDIENG